MIKAVAHYLYYSIIIIQELLPHSMLSFLHNGELCDVEVFRYSRQVAMGMEYLHSQGILHCDLAARNISYLIIINNQYMYNLTALYLTPHQIVLF